MVSGFVRCGKFLNRYDYRDRPLHRAAAFRDSQRHRRQRCGHHEECHRNRYGPGNRFHNSHHRGPEPRSNATVLRCRPRPKQSSRDLVRGWHQRGQFVSRNDQRSGTLYCAFANRRSHDCGECHHRGIGGRRRRRHRPQPLNFSRWNPVGSRRITAIQCEHPGRCHHRRHLVRRRHCRRQHFGWHNQRKRSVHGSECNR